MRRARALALLLLAGALASPTLLTAQAVAAPRPPKPTRTDSVEFAVDTIRFRFDSLRSRNYVLRDSLQTVMVQAFTRRRVRIGVVVSTQPAESDSIGARLDAVTPNGPAAAGGLRAGDIITTFGGTKLAISLTSVAPGTRVASPGFRLVELVAKLAPNDTVPVEYRRGKSKLSTKVVTAADPENLAVVVGPGGNFEFGSMPGAEEYWVGQGREMEQQALELALLRSEAARGSRANAELQYTYFLGGALRDLELAPVNPQLGSYFGTTEGVLVVDVPAPAPLNLKAGDVVMKVDGREVTSPRQLMRILGSYAPREPLALEVMRQKKRLTLKGSLGAQPGVPETNK